jgi:hypothetical protein
LNYKVYKNVIAIPSPKDWDQGHYLFDENEELIPTNSFFGINRGWFDVTSVPSFLKPSSRGIVPTKVIETPSIFGGWYLSWFGHYITDAMVRFWFIQNRSEESYFFPIIRECTKIGGPPWLKQFETVAGIDNSKFNLILEPILFKELIVPEPAWNYRSVPNQLWWDFVDTCNWTPSLQEFPEKVYFPRNHKQKSDKSETVVFGEKAFIEYLKGEGFYIVDELSSVSDQRELARHAKHIVTVDGSSVYWSMFSQSEDRDLTVIARRPEEYEVVSSTLFTDVAAKFIETSLIEHVIGWIGNDNHWTSKSSFLDWEKISQDMKIMGLVNSVFKEKGQSRKDLLEFVVLNGNTESLWEQAEKILDIYAYRGV